MLNVISQIYFKIYAYELVEKRGKNKLEPRNSLNNFSGLNKQQVEIRPVEVKPFVLENKNPSNNFKVSENIDKEDNIRQKIKPVHTEKRVIQFIIQKKKDTSQKSGGCVII